MEEIAIKPDKELNIPALDKTLREAFGERTAGVRWDGETLSVYMLDSQEGDEQVVKEKVAAHDPEVLTPEQEVVKDSQTARYELLEIVDNRIGWHKENPVTTQNAVEVLRRIQVEWVYLLRLLRSERL